MDSAARSLVTFAVRLVCGLCGCVLAAFGLRLLFAPFSDAWPIALLGGSVCGALLEVASTGRSRPWRGAISLPAFYFLTSGSLVLATIVLPGSIHAPAVAYVLGLGVFVALVVRIRRGGLVRTA